MIRKPIILDTDIGTDVDDLLALSLVLTSPELELVGVTTVYGDVAPSTHMARRLLMLRGVRDIPLPMGASKPLLGKRGVYVDRLAH
jgi:purine nucleosidase